MSTPTSAETHHDSQVPGDHASDASLVTPNRRPLRLSGAAAVGLAMLAVATLAGGPVGRALGVELAGIALLAVAVWVARTRSRLLGVLLGLPALGVVPLGLGLVWLATGDLLVVGQLAFGLLGVFLVALGVLPVRGRGSRWLVKLGTALVMLGVFAAAVVGRPGLTALLGAGIATVLAWDAGDYAIGVGRQLGRRASTWRVELSHVAASVLVGVVALVAGRAVDGLGSPGLGLGSFLVLLTGLLCLSVALYD